jgi:3-oxoadipate enol-lactonase/4-carboxymuconolactone decarboxylase
MTRLGWVDDPAAVVADELLVLLPSLGTTSRLFDGLVATLRPRQELAVVLVDLPGHGIAPRADEVSIAALADEVADVIDRSSARSARVAGVSMGGAVAFEVARRRPANLRGFAMINSGIRFGSAEGWRQLIETVQRDGTASLRSGSSAGWFSDAFAGSASATALLDELPVIDDASYIACCRALAAYDGRDGAEAIDARALLIGTADDEATPSDGLRGLARLLPAADLHELPEGRHLSVVEHVTAVATIIGHWLAKDSSIVAVGHREDGQ